MKNYTQARAWIDKQPPAVSGQNGHAQAFHVAAILTHGFDLSDGDSESLFREYSARCSPPWSDREIAHKLAEGRKGPHDKPRGFMLKMRHESHAITHPRQQPKQKMKPKPLPETPDSAELPAPIADGARALLNAAFEPGEGVCIVPAKLNEELREIPASEGTVLSREEWTRLLDAHNGNPNGIFSSSKRTGLYIRVNPMRQGRGTDADVSAFRHCLIESDEVSKIEQFHALLHSRLPISAVIDSGKKSIHAWVRVDATSRDEYTERQKMVADYMAAMGFKIDPKNKNPSRFSRLPNCVRFDSRQELIAVKIGAPSFSEWVAEVNAESLGDEHDIETLLNFKGENDPNVLLGNRWICKGGSFLISAPSGVGKSSLAMQLSLSWIVGAACGRSNFGITAHRPMRILIVQGENDEGDLAEQLQGCVKGMKLGPQEIDALKKHLKIHSLDAFSGDECISALHRLVEKHRPDIAWLDPIAAFAGEDLGKQTTIAKFCRQGLGGISRATGVAWFVVNHTTKPPTDPRAKKGWKSTDHQHGGAGSYDLPGWARAVALLEDAGGNLFRLRLAKRGKRAGATHPSGEPTTTIWLEHANDGSIFWRQVEPPNEEETERKKPDQKREIASMNLHSFIASLTGEAMNQTAKKLEAWLAKQNIDASLSTCKRIIPMLVENGKLEKTEDGRYVKGKNA